MRAGGGPEPLRDHGGPGHHMRHGHGRNGQRAVTVQFSIRQRVVRVSYEFICIYAYVCMCVFIQMFITTV